MIQTYDGIQEEFPGNQIPADVVDRDHNGAPRPRWRPRSPSCGEQVGRSDLYEPAR